jgi:hypothetical protein
MLIFKIAFGVLGIFSGLSCAVVIVSYVEFVIVTVPSVKLIVSFIFRCKIKLSDRHHNETVSRNKGYTFDLKDISFFRPFNDSISFNLSERKGIRLKYAKVFFSSFF